MKLIFSELKRTHCCDESNGLVESIKFLLSDYNDGARSIVPSLVNAY